MPIRLVTLLTLLLALKAPAAHWFVRQGAPGADNGRNWIDAWTNTTEINWDIVQPGDSIWIAGGTYGPMVIRATGATNQPLYIARVRDYNTAAIEAAGWGPGFDLT